LATQEGLELRSYLAAADLSDEQYFIVATNGTDDTAALAAADSDNIIGVLQNKPSAAGQMASVAIRGKVKVVRPATVSIAAGTWVTADSAGKAVPLLHSDGDIVTVLGMCTATLGATGNNELIEVELHISRIYAGAAQS